MKTTILSLLLLSPLLGAAVGRIAQGVTVIDTQSLWSGSIFTNTSSGPVTWNLGQTFTVPLAGDTIFDKGYLNFRSLAGRSFTMNLGAVAGSAITSVLATANKTLVGNGSWENIQFDPVNVPLTPGGTYALWAAMPLNPTTVDIQSFTSSVYSGGLYLTSGAVMPGNIQTFGANDAAFRVEFVPEPSSGVLISMLAGAGVVWRRVWWA